MSMTTLQDRQSVRVDSTVGAMIRDWREKRGRSQSELSMAIGISQRHISFVESGRSMPSRALLVALSEALGIPFRNRNGLLLAAGFAPIYSDKAWNSEEMRVVGKAVERLLKQHEPLPAMALDWQWNVLVANQCALRFFGEFFEMSDRPGEQNMLRMIMDPNALRPFIENWAEVATGFIESMNRDSIGCNVDDLGQGLLSEFLSSPDATRKWSAKGHLPSTPVIAFSFVKGDRLLKYFSMSSTVGMPQATASQEVRVETLFPADEATETWHFEHFSLAVE
jgi:transcriptional regulator with XRE-family HTH domain